MSLSPTRQEVSGPKVTLSNLVAGFGDNTVLHGISMKVPGQSVTSIIGPSGCGKSTMIRCINRMHELVPSAFVSGEISLEGKNVYATDVDPVMLRRRVGMVFQKPNPFPNMTIRENVLAGLRLTGQLKHVNPDDVTQQALEGAALWDEVKDRLDSPGIGLSGGQQQRLCIARAIAVEPDVLLMDEPCSALDPIATSRIEELIRQLKEKFAIVIVTHNMQQAARASDQTAFLLMGELVEFTETSRLFTQPLDSRTEDYITGKFG